MNEPKTLTVGELRRELSLYKHDTPLFFGAGDLSFHRAKNRGAVGADLVQIEFNELYSVRAEG